MSSANDPEVSTDATEEADPWAEAMAEQALADQAIADKGGAEAGGSAATPAQATPSSPPAPANGAPAAEPAALESLAPDQDGGPSLDANLDVILDIPVTISMDVGSTEISIRNLLQLNQGSVVELNRLAGEPLDVLVNGTLVAHGEVVVVNDKFGIRLTDVVSPAERIKKLK
jgi:flagellar motor switch protein FliN/FliY